MGNCKDLKPGRIIFYLLPILYCRFEKQKGFMKTMTTLLSLCVNTGLTDTVLPQRGIIIRALVRVVTRSVVAVRETVTLVYLIKTLIYGKQRESKDHRIKKREREREGHHVSLSAVKFDTSPRRSQRKKQNNTK